jgi:hypothetical protein
MKRRLRFAVHNVIAHPLLVLCPPVGRWLHDKTAPAGELTKAEFARQLEAAGNARYGTVL